VAAAQNGTSGALADGKRTGRRAAWASPRTGDDQGQTNGRSELRLKHYIAIYDRARR
jgi:hypothetical protein